MIGRLVQQQNVRLHCEQRGETGAGAFAAGELGELPGRRVRGQAEAIEEGFEPVGDSVTAGGLEARLGGFPAIERGLAAAILLGEGGGRVVELAGGAEPAAGGGVERFREGAGFDIERALGQHADPDAGRDAARAGVGWKRTGKDLHQGRLASPVWPDQAEAVAAIEVQVKLSNRRLSPKR